MQLIHVAAVALNQTPLDWAGNTTNIINAITAAREQGATLVALPELCLTGYGCEDAFFSIDVQKRALLALFEVLPHTEQVVVSIGLPLLHNGALYNCVCLIADQKVLGFVAKNRLAGDGIHYEPRWFKAWDSQQVSEIEIQGRNYPIGNLIFNCGGVRIGFEICEDAWAADRPGRELAMAGVDLILNPSASHFAFGKQDIRRRLVLESARAYGVTYLYANLLGNEAGRIIYDGATLIASSGNLLVEGQRLLFSDYVVTTSVVDVDLTRIKRTQLMSFQPHQQNKTLATVKTAFTFPDIEPRSIKNRVAPWETDKSVKEEEFTRAVALGLYDYLRKSRSKGFVVSLSGGADSAAVVVLVWSLVQFGLAELGPQRFQSRLSHIKELDHLNSAEPVVQKLLTCVYQATENSSEATERAASALAASLGAEFLKLDVDPIVQSYVGFVSNAIGRDLNWEDDDVALQNIQARVRAPGVWLLANLRDALLLATSNRSEAAVGYTTMDGDTCGGLSPIAGIDKAFLRKWLDWMCHAGPMGVGSLSTLELVNRQEPTAELRPQQAGQTDESDLMPYELLDWIERAAIRDKKGPVDLFRMARAEFPDYQPAELADWVARFFRLWSRNQWKRERYAPSFHLDDENLDPKTWCRFPILSGGFEQELLEMNDLL
ncbi:NAD(+) synthase [Gimesia aquarii]|uniref:Glutamine-dependent NAD(+) synthetase n=1 Tax=Gimesia aquarii TaxID=2527964 RepID=A0A517VTY1_9PLAN|nr:NAD(+) synthase [Gimesia aquarii]QDT96466.1 Glutamine-dependent NAD(+) synthetase [Gimesia aquarii]